MSNNIKAGDLVVVVKPRLCCGDQSSIGGIFVVGKFIQRSSCGKCGVQSGLFATVKGSYKHCEVQRLKRIPPLEKLEGQRTEEGMRAPACS